MPSWGLGDQESYGKHGKVDKDGQSAVEHADCLAVAMSMTTNPTGFSEEVQAHITSNKLIDDFAGFTLQCHAGVPMDSLALNVALSTGVAADKVPCRERKPAVHEM